MPGDWLRPSQVAGMSGVSAATVLRWIREGKLNAIRTLGGHYRVDKVSAEAFHAQLTLVAALSDPAVVEHDKARLATFTAGIREQAARTELHWWGSESSPSPRDVKVAERCRREAAEAKRAARGREFLKMRFGLSREELYALVWTKPVTEIAKRFGLSDTGLRKSCVRYRIPVPPRGYWSSRNANKRTKTFKRPRLPSDSRRTCTHKRGHWPNVCSWGEPDMPGWRK
jgi:excisionase family DNA binding protein